MKYRDRKKAIALYQEALGRIADRPASHFWHGLTDEQKDAIINFEMWVAQVVPDHIAIELRQLEGGLHRD